MKYTDFIHVSVKDWELLGKASFKLAKAIGFLEGLSAILTGEQKEKVEKILQELKSDKP